MARYHGEQAVHVSTDERPGAIDEALLQKAELLRDLVVGEDDADADLVLKLRKLPFRLHHLVVSEWERLSAVNDAG
jgi:hypothetical protein